ncbi:UDP-N-acetylglucosamine 4,6-dehydratase [Rhodovulum adriaticum]|uniref:Polysaccharide biosynthesis protein n=1 Tax=Rhodovulum adriaticum TaxID=35804 RepID=A0A4R2NHH3_RHOAD|nr:UDP-N-acetylglucosamine 4,6-dehydratase [Rhodovulum adriaticum]MBK1636535.1 UDP-N-acetylglucosamine 4,6-dehydratase [Rhodovulum adriaticum]TCP20760.1 polysaccharide biosynthesis protein [Rhodovulum adriaticum]
MNALDLIGRDEPLFQSDLTCVEADIAAHVSASRFLVIGGAGSIGQAVTREIFKRNPRALHVVDISENNMVELVRDIRSTLGYIDGDFRTFAIDCGSVEFRALVDWAGGYDYVLNLSALKHVRSEKDPFTLMRMVDVNILNTIETLAMARSHGATKYFCVSTDKAANPVNMMGASKRIMEMFLMRESDTQPISTARFANVAFSDGSLLHGFNQRFMKRQPISAPRDVRRYFVTPQESGELCLLSCLLGENRDIFFPKLSEKLDLISFAEIADRFLKSLGYEPYHCASEEEARADVEGHISRGRWPCYFFDSDTTGEKPFEEFFMAHEEVDLDRFESIGVIRNDLAFESDRLDEFLRHIADMKARGTWGRSDLVALFNRMLPDFAHAETGKFLDDRM